MMRPCEPRCHARAARSGRPTATSELKRGKIRDKCRLILKATQIEDVCAILDASDHRSGKPSKRDSRTFKRCRRRARCATGSPSRHLVSFQAATHPNRSDSHKKRLQPYNHWRGRHDRQQPLRAGFDRRLRPRQQADGRKRLGIAVEAQRRFNCRLTAIRVIGGRFRRS